MSKASSTSGRKILATRTGAAAVFCLMIGGAIAVPSAFASPHEVFAFDGTYSGTSYTYTNLTEVHSSVSPVELGPNGTATFTTTISSDQYAAAWDNANPELIIAGLRQAAGPDRARTLQGDGSLIYAQDNSNGFGYCSNDQFLDSSGAFVFGAGAPGCYVHGGAAGSTETYSVTITGNNTFTDTVSFPNGTAATHVGAFTCTVSTCSDSFTGTLSLPATTRYYPAVYLLPGRTATDATTPATFIVSNTDYSLTRAHGRKDQNGDRHGHAPDQDGNSQDGNSQDGNGQVGNSQDGNGQVGIGQG